MLLRETTFQLHGQQDGGEGVRRQCRAREQFIEARAVAAERGMHAGLRVVLRVAAVAGSGAADAVEQIARRPGRRGRVRRR